MTMSDTELGPLLLATARGAIERHLGARDAQAPEHPALLEPGASFVTLTCDGELRGCIGSLEARRPLGEDVAANAIAAASRDLRFSPVERNELEHIRVEVSVLTRPRLLQFADERELLQSLRPGVDGVLLSAHGRSATFLPQVWEQLPDPRMFLGALKRKAGLEPGVAATEMTIATYQVRKWKEAERSTASGSLR